MKKLFTFLTALLLTSTAFAQQIPNNDFAIWQTKTGFGLTGPYTYDMPQDWELGIISDLLAGFGMKPNISKAPVGLGSNFALQLSSTADTIGADIQCSFALPPNSGPHGLVGTFKTSGVVTDPNDYGIALVFMTKWNGTSRDTVGVGMGDLASSPNIFSNFQVPIQYTSSVLPDSANVYFFYFPEEANTHIQIDGLALVTLLGTEKDATAKNQLKLYPNPVADKATLTFNTQKAGKGTVMIRDMVGRELKAMPLNNLTAGNNTIPVETAGLKKGIYTITLQTEKETQTLRFLKQ